VRCNSQYQLHRLHSNRHRDIKNAGMAQRSSSTDAKRSAKASRRCHCLPELSVLRLLQGLSRCNTRVTTDLVDPGAGWSTTGTSPLLRGPVTISRLGTDSKDLVCRYITSIRLQNKCRYAVPTAQINLCLQLRRVRKEIKAVDTVITRQ